MFWPTDNWIKKAKSSSWWCVVRNRISLPIGLPTNTLPSSDRHGIYFNINPLFKAVFYKHVPQLGLS